MPAITITVGPRSGSRTVIVGARPAAPVVVLNPRSADFSDPRNSALMLLLL